ncbi:MAG: thioredoxin domain-containing protein [Pseudomonadota bacterium]
MKDRIKDILFAAIVIGGVAFFAVTGRSAETERDYVHGAAPAVIAATFSSAWCASCKILEPKLADLAPVFADQPVQFIKLDFTFGQYNEQKARAAALNFEGVFNAYEGATGFTLLLDAETGVLIDTLTANHSKNAMEAAIAQALSIAQRNN